MHIATYKLLVYGLTNFVAAIVSGISGGGAGFITTPLLIFLGLTPAQAVSTGKLNGLAIAAGSLQSLRNVRQTSWRRIGGYMLLAFVVGLLAPYIIRSLDSQIYRRILGILILGLVPLFIYKKVGYKTQAPSRLRKTAGYGLLGGSLALQGVFSGGLGTLVNAVLMGFLGTTALEANVIKRYSQLVLNAVIVLGLIGSHLIQWPFAITGMATGLLGGIIGGRIAIQQGNRTVLMILLGLMVLSGVWLIV